MQAFFITLTQLLILSSLFLLGYFIKKKNYITDAAAKGMSFILISISTPATIFSSLQIGYTPQRLKSGALMIFCYMLIMLVGFAISLLLAKVFMITGNEKKVWLTSGMMFNCFFIGAPITRALYGEMSMFYLCFGLLGWNLVTYTLCLRIFTGKPENSGALGSLTTLLKTPAVIACIVSFVFFAFRLPLPGFILSTADYLGQMTIPLSALLLGVIASAASMKEIFSGKNVYIFSAIRLIIIPLASIPLFRLILSDVNAANTVIIGAAMPVATLIPIFAETYAGYGKEGTKYCLVSTILSLLSLPFISAVLSVIG